MLNCLIIYFKNGIECGANDGVNQSNTWYFEISKKGLLIEPHFLKSLKKIDQKNI